MHKLYYDSYVNVQWKDKKIGNKMNRLIIFDGDSVTLWYRIVNVTADKIMYVFTFKSNCVRL